MSAQHPSPDLARLQATVATLQADLTRLKRRRHFPRRSLPVFLAVLLVALVPLATLAANPFTDLVPGSPHNGNIDLIYNAGITTGCVPNAEYCPTANVTREEMASFLARTAGLGTNLPIVNAKTAQTATNATNAQNAVNAQNAATLDGYAPSELTRLAFASNDGDLSLGASGTLQALTVTIATTRQSYVRVSFTGYAYTSSTTGCPCVVRGRLALNGGTPQTVVQSIIATEATDIVAGFDRRPLAGARVYLVPPGTHTITLIVDRFNGTSTTLGFSHPALQAELYPFGGTGAGATQIGGTGGQSPTDTAP